jgi:hypothetical protein
MTGCAWHGFATAKPKNASVSKADAIIRKWECGFIDQ